jgi:sodium-independent sulfate anion transporter 11
LTLTITGVTVGAVAVPQGMAYALLAMLPVEYFLYTSFMGFLVYWFFATSKDITIGAGILSQTLPKQRLILFRRSQPCPRSSETSLLKSKINTLTFQRKR